MEEIGGKTVEGEIVTDRVLPALTTFHVREAIEIEAMLDILKERNIAGQYG